MTVFGLLFVIPALVAFLYRPRWLPFLLVVAAVFQAASVLNIPLSGYPIGISPYYFVSLLIVFRFALLLVSGKLERSVPRQLVIPIFLLLAFSIWSVAGSFLLPSSAFFSGIGVYVPRAGIGPPEDSIFPLIWGAGNIAQAGYLVLNTLVLLYIVLTCRDESDFRLFRKGIITAGGIVLGVALYEQLAISTGLYFPASVIYSNPAYFHGFGVFTGSVARINATFSEPSLAASFLTGLFAYGIVEYMAGAERSRRRIAWLVLIVIVLLFTRASTGYLAFIVLTTLLLARYALVPILQGKVHFRFILTLVVLGVSTICFAFFLPSLVQTIPETLLEKSDSLSYFFRISSDLFAIDLVKETYGLGVGLGSNRPSSFLTYLASNVGIPGLLLFLIMIGSIVGSLRRQKRALLAISPAHWGMRTAFVWGLGLVLVAKTIAVPDLSDPILWIFLIGLFLSVSTASRREVPIGQTAQSEDNSHHVRN